jgi:hypothetical protein
MLSAGLITNLKIGSEVALRSYRAGNPLQIEIQLLYADLVFRPRRARSLKTTLTEVEPRD